MNEQWNDFSPDEAALKAELEALAQNLHPDATFVAALEKQLIQQVQIQSIEAIRQKPRRFSPNFVLVAAAMLIVFACAVSISAGFFLTKDECSENCVLVTVAVGHNPTIAANVASSQTVVAILSTETQLSIEVPATQAAVIGTPTPLPNAGGGRSTQMAASPSPLSTMGFQLTMPAQQPNIGAGANATTAAGLQPLLGMTGTPFPSMTPLPTNTAPPMPGTSVATATIPLPDYPNSATLLPNFTATTTPTITTTPTGTPLPTNTATPSRTPALTQEVLQPTATPLIPPEEMPPDMFFEHYGVNPFLDTRDDPLSTFALDVDSASYTLTRSYLVDSGTLPPTAAIRPEEFINYFDMDYPAPAGDDAFGITLDAAPAPFGYDGHYLMRVGIQGQYLPPEARDPMLLILVIDVSGSMADGGRLELVKRSVGLMVEELRPDDRLGVVVYTDTAMVLFDPLPLTEKQTILNAINGLQPQDSTNVEDGLRLGYDMADRYRLLEQKTRLILLSDGVANVGVTDPEGILNRVRNSVQNNITLTSIGVGMGNYNDVLMEQLANDGDGNYYYVDTLREAQRVLVYNIVGTLQVIAYDAKIQVEFNPEVADRYRLIGYENRAVADADFRNDTVDAGEVGAGQNATALYELALEEGDVNGVIATVYVRYQDAETREIVEISRQLTTADLLQSMEEAPPSFRLAAVAAEFAELLRESYWAEEGSYADLLIFAQPLAEVYADDPNVMELLDLIRLAGRYVDR